MSLFYLTHCDIIITNSNRNWYFNACNIQKETDYSDISPNCLLGTTDGGGPTDWFYARVNICIRFFITIYHVSLRQIAWLIKTHKWHVVEQEKVWLSIRTRFICVSQQGMGQWRPYYICNGFSTWLIPCWAMDEKTSMSQWPWSFFMRFNSLFHRR